MHFKRIIIFPPKMRRQSSYLLLNLGLHGRHVISGKNLFPESCISCPGEREVLKLKYVNVLIPFAFQASSVPCLLFQELGRSL
jgi:hypothetical protein